MVIIDTKDFNNMYWRDDKGTWWARSGVCCKCGACCRVEGYCEYFKNDICLVKEKFPGTNTLSCYLGPFPTIETDEMKQKCSYKWKKTTIEEIL